MPTIAQLAKPYLELGGEFVDPIAFRDRSINIRGLAGLDLYDWKAAQRRSIETPKGVTLSSPEWSPDGSRIAYWANFDDGSRLYVADTSTGKSHALGRGVALTTYTTKIQWVDGGRAVMAVFVPANVGPVPKAPAVPDQPLVLVADPKKNSLRTYASLLKDKHQAQQFEYFTTGQLMRVSLNGDAKAIGQPAMIRSFDASLDGKFARVTTTLKPFSYIVPTSSFGQKEELWDESGKALAELSKRELTFDDSPTDPTPRAGRGGQAATGGDGKRNLAWRPDGKGLSFLQLEPKSEGADASAARKDRVMQWLPPYGEKDVAVTYETADRMSSARFSADCQTLFITETKGTNENTYAIRLSEAGKKYPLYSRKPDDFYANPGTLMSEDTPTGVSAIRITPTGSVLLSGVDYAKDPEKTAPRPFLDSVSIATGTKTRLWQSAADVYETVSNVLNPDATTFMLLRQSKTMVPASFVKDLASGTLSKTIENKDYAPDITQAIRYRVQVTRADGFKFWCAVTLPKWASKTMKLPAFFWFYPSEYRDQKGYDDSKRTLNNNTYPSMGGATKDYFVTQGYALVEPDCPIIGTATAVNDNYVSDLRMNLTAVIDTLCDAGTIDRAKLALGGHSYGAFSTVNAMIQTPFFKAGIAGDGNYNRLLTPFAFQAESRKLWEAKWTYLEMSPMLYAERLNGALLMYHSIADQNVGTDPINSPRLFAALESMGKPAALYMYPYEDHGQIAQETLLDMWARWVMWLDKYVKGKE